MKLHFYHRNTDEKLSNLDEECRYWLANLVSTLSEMPVSIWPDKSDKQKNKSVLQSVHNYYLKFALSTYGWAVEPFVSNPEESARRADFNAGKSHLKIVTEAEFGNTARIDSAIVKYQKGFFEGTVKLAVLVLATNKLATVTDSGLATFEAAVNEIKNYSFLQVPFPLVVIGIEADERTTVLNWSTASKLKSAKCLSGNGDRATLAHVVSEYCNGVWLGDIGAPETEAEILAAKELARQLNEPVVCPAKARGLTFAERLQSIGFHLKRFCGVHATEFFVRVQLLPPSVPVSSCGWALA